MASALTELEIADALFEMHGIISRIIEVELNCNQQHYAKLSANQQQQQPIADFRERISLSDKVILMTTGYSLKHAFEELNVNYTIAILVATSLIELMRMKIIQLEFCCDGHAKPVSFALGDWIIKWSYNNSGSQATSQAQEQEQQHHHHNNNQHQSNAHQHKQQPVIVHDDVMDLMIQHFYAASILPTQQQHQQHLDGINNNTMYKWLKRFLALDSHTGETYHIPTIPAHCIKSAKQKKLITEKKVPMLLIFSVSEYQVDIEEQDSISQLLHDAIDCMKQYQQEHGSEDNEQQQKSKQLTKPTVALPPLPAPPLQGSISSDDLITIQLFLELVKDGSNAADLTHLLNAVNNSNNEDEEQQDKKHHNSKQQEKEAQNRMIKLLQQFMTTLTHYYNNNNDKA